MWQGLFRYPINTTLPLFLLVVALILGTLYTLTLIHNQQRSILANAERELATEISRMQRIVQNHLANNGTQAIQDEIAALNVDIRVRLAGVVDERQHYVAALNRGMRERPLAETLDAEPMAALADPLRTLLTDARDRRAAKVRHVAGENTLIAVAPLQFTGPLVDLGRSPSGAVILAWDLSLPFRQARTAALNSALLLAPILIAALAALWWLIYQALGRRLSRLSRTAEQIAGGEHHQRAGVTGRDEIGRLARAFDRMADGLVQEQARLRESEQRLYLAQAFSGVGTWEWEIASGDLVWTRPTYQLFDLPEDTTEVTFEHYLERVHPDDRARVQAAVEQSLEQGTAYSIEHRVLTRDGDERWLLGSGDVLRDADGQPRRMYGIVQDITATKRAEAALFREKEYAQVTLASIGDGVITTDTRGRVTFLNPIAEYLTGWTTDAATGEPLTRVFNILNEITRKPAVNPVERCLKEGRIVGLANHTMLLRKDGQEFAIEDSAAPIRDRDGEIVGVVLVFHDVTQARELANQLSWQATHDALTGLPNRHAFEQRLEQLARYPESQKGHENHTLLYIDLDQFKVVNDVAGHVAGDQMIRQVGELMLDQVRETDLLARLGGDEFGIILTHCDIAHADRIANAIHTVLDELRFAWEDRVFRISASIGIIEFQPGERSMNQLLADADIAVYAAKNAGRRRSHIFRPEDQDLQQHRREMDWATQISDAVEQGRLVLFAQMIHPLAEPDSGAPPAGLSFEVLVRLRSQDDELIPPGVFLPAAERFDLISIVDRWIITRTFSMVADHIRLHGPASIEHCAVNLSGATLSDETLLPFIRNQLSLHQLPGEIFCFEVTETAAISNLQAAMRFIRDLRGMGCRFALDDFGSGLSSFAYLKTLPVDYLKIDGSFVRNIATDPVNDALVGNINNIGHLLDKKTIAEFAEDESTIARLRELNVDFAQGYGLHRPQPLEELFAMHNPPR
ncbi:MULTISPECIES: EAL domain-containing protein [unclassified Thioalkalivibrio]|uniref:EAL domain-containing protein n=1 Tax=unclassified Thioalkalivibrio TaxID=2621013 RepID=UPI000382708D|nr:MULTISPECIES: EAL domain-containing protein [unclassified Thioalkalivibrio]